MSHFIKKSVLGAAFAVTAACGHNDNVEPPFVENTAEATAPDAEVEFRTVEWNEYHHMVRDAVLSHEVRRLRLDADALQKVKNDPTFEQLDPAFHGFFIFRQLQEHGAVLHGERAVQSTDMQMRTHTTMYINMVDGLEQDHPNGAPSREWYDDSNLLIAARHAPENGKTYDYPGHMGDLPLGEEQWLSPEDLLAYAKEKGVPCLPMQPVQAQHNRFFTDIDEMAVYYPNVACENIAEPK